MICVQVLGSIPRDDLVWVVDRFYGIANKVIFVSERLKLPRKQIYSDIADQMPHGISYDDWVKILRPRKNDMRLSVPKMIFAAKDERWVIGEINL